MAREKERPKCQWLTQNEALSAFAMNATGHQVQDTSSRYIGTWRVDWSSKVGFALMKSVRVPHLRSISKASGGS